MLFVTLTPLVADLCHLSVSRSFSVYSRATSLQRKLLAPRLPCVIPQFLLFPWHLACHGLGDSKADMAVPALPRPVFLSFVNSESLSCCFLLPFQVWFHHESAMTRAIREIPSTG